MDHHGANTTPRLSLTDELRLGTKNLHGRTDRLVQAGLFAALDHKIYRQIMLGFYYVFKTFEEEYECHCRPSSSTSSSSSSSSTSSSGHPWLLKTYSPELCRTASFEKDLAFFYGPDWRDQVQPSPQAESFMAHIREISKTSPQLLVAYPCTLYLGLFFGGQITRSQIIKSTNFFPAPKDETTGQRKKLGGDQDNGIAVFTFREADGTKSDPNKIKNQLKERLNGLGQELDAKDRAMILTECKEIFVRDMDMMVNVEGIAAVWYRWAFKLVLYVAIGVALVQMLYTKVYGKEDQVVYL